MGKVEGLWEREIGEYRGTGNRVRELEVLVKLWDG